MKAITERTVPEEHYLGEVSRLSSEIHNLEERLNSLKKILIELKIDIRNVQFFEPDDYELDKVVEKIEKAMMEGE